MRADGPPPSADWHELAQKASKERDAEKLLDLVNALCDRLDQTSDRNPSQSAPAPESQVKSSATR